MNITFCDVCRSEVTRDIQPQGHWRMSGEDSDNGKIVTMCQSCLDDVSDTIRESISMHEDKKDITFKFDKEKEEE